MAFSQEGGDNTGDEDQQKPGRKYGNADGQGTCGDDLLEHPPDHLNHQQPVGGLHPRALELVVEHWIFIRRKVETRGVLHNPDAHMPGVFVSQESVAVADSPLEGAADRRQPEFERNEPPEVRTQAAVVCVIHYSIDDQASHVKRGKGD